MILTCIRYLREKFPAVRVSVEVEKPARPGLQELAVEADVVFYSKSWAQVFLQLPRYKVNELLLTINRDKPTSRPRNAFENSPN